MSALSAVGSSPLARGLQEVAGVFLGLLGIIPARAGFTSDDRGAHRVFLDHPRSRGVYKWGACGGLERLGSSPLARGLPGHEEEAVPLTGIIPARAGFTGRGRG